MLNIFCVFLWKQLLYLRYNWRTIIFILIGCFVIMFIYLKSTLLLLKNDACIYESKDRDILKLNFPAHNDEDFILYTPDAPFTNQLMDKLRTELQLPHESLRLQNTENALRYQLENNCHGNCFAVVFSNFPGHIGNATTRDGLSYTLSSTSIRVSPKKRYVNDEEVNGIKDEDDYIRTGFLTLQNIIDTLYIQMQTNTESNVFDFEISSLPSIAIETIDSQRVTLFGSLFVILLNVLLLSTFLVPLVEEKEHGLKEFLCLATPYNYLNGVTFFLLRLCWYLVFIAGCLIVAYYYQALGIVPIFYIIILFALYLLSAMLYTYLISVCFNSVFYAKVGGLLLLVMPFVFYFVQDKAWSLTSFFFSTKSFMDGMQILQIFTNKHRQFQAIDLFNNITKNSFNLAEIYMMFICQCALYTVVYNYLSLVFNERDGPHRHFFILFEYIFGKKNQKNEHLTSNRDDVAIIIQDLVKTFHTDNREITIANGLNMEIKNKHITVLLGHNGAGKTTTINMIIGAVPKDSGKITVCSERDVSSYRHLIGYCPQHSVFLYYMTCRQHLEFFARLRGLSRKNTANVVAVQLNDLNLMHKEHEYGINLSGGMKRRLSLGMAISGDTKVVILDEPSSGLDIESRRELWDILLKLRKTKAVLVTTHHMEEAEVLGDTISILANGRLDVTGSPLDLKRKYGNGYILKLCTHSECFNLQETLDFIRQKMPNVAVLNVVPPTVLISMAYSNKNQYSETLKCLEEQQKSLGIQSITVTDTSLEDVFLNYYERSAAQLDVVDGPSAQRPAIRDTPYQRLDNAPISKLQQFLAVFYKKFIYLFTDKRIYTCCMLLLPILSAAFAIILMHSVTTIGNDNVLALNMQQIDEGVVYLHHASDRNYSRNLEKILTKTLLTSNIRFEHLNLTSTQTVPEELIRIQQEDLAHFLQTVVGAIDLQPSENGKIKLSVYFSGNIYHSSVILMNLIDDAVLKLETHEGESIETGYVPIKRVLTDVSPTRLEYYAVIMPIGLFFYMFFYVSLPFQENISDFKNLQPMPRYLYWSAVLTFDVVLHLIVCILLWIFQVIVMPKSLYSISDINIIIWTIFFYGLSYLPILYCLANMFRSISALSTYLLFMMIVSAIIPLITSGNIQAMQTYETTILFMSILPDFNLNHQLRIINENFFIHHRCLKMNLMNELHNVKHGGKPSDGLLDTSLFFVYAVLIFSTALFFFINYWENKKLRQNVESKWKCRERKDVSLMDDIDMGNVCESLVRDEKNIVNRIISEKSESDYPLLVDKLTKLYDRKVAVRGISFAVKKQECFGLLGVNGAGKTTTFQMLTTNCTTSAGHIKINGIDIDKNEEQYKNQFGYCPQHDCLNNFMTSYQMLKYMALMRGVNYNEIHSEVMYWMKNLDLLKYEDVCIRYYSGGTKRKLNAAIAMIGSPPIVFLDEPTTGVDPVSRRFLWKCIQDYQKRDKTVILTSHSMDECEQLCNRLAIMADGEFKCIGYVPELKQRYGTGFTINIKMAVSNTDENVEIITEQLGLKFTEFELRENHAGMLTFFIKSNDTMKWSSVFDGMEQLRVECENFIEEYSVNETKLEDIFLNFKPKQHSRRTTNAFINADIV